MKCNNCQSTWETPESIVVTQCPFCHSELPKNYPDDSIERKMIEIVNKHSPEIYDNKAKFLKVISESLPNTELTKLLKAIIPNGATQEVYKLANCPKEEFASKYTQILDIIIAKTFIPTDIIAPAVDLLCIGLGLDFGSITVGKTKTIFDDFKIDNNSLIKYVGNDKNVVIPSSVNRIEHGAFEDCTSITGVAIPNSVNYIGHGVFAHCTNLTRIIIPETVTNIGDNTFAHCTSLRVISLPHEVTSIGYRAFYYCTSLSEMVIPDSVTYIGLGAFYQCYNLSESTKNKIKAVNSDAIDVGKYIIR